jgi:hypothetical protein
MRFVRKQLRHSLAIAVIGHAVLGGCTSPPKSQPPDPEVRAKFVRIGLSVSPRFGIVNVNPPDAPGTKISEALDGGGGSAEGALVGILLTPVLALGGAMLDGVAGEQKSAIAGDLLNLRRAARMLRFDAILRERITARAKAYFSDRSPFAEVALDAPLDRTNSVTASVADRQPQQIFPDTTVRRLFWARTDLDAWLDIEALEPGLKPDGGRQRMAVHVRARMENHGGGSLHYDYLEYRGPAHSLAEWAADDARLFRAEVDRCATLLADEVVEQLFVRTSLDASTSRRLASLGITRRD